MKATITALLLSTLLPATLLAETPEEKLHTAGTECLKILFTEVKNVPAEKAGLAADATIGKMIGSGGFELSEAEKKALTEGTLEIKDFDKTVASYQQFKTPPYNTFATFATKAAEKDLTPAQKLFMVKLLDKLVKEKASMWLTHSLSKAKVAVLTVLQHKIDHGGKEPKDFSQLKLEDQFKFVSPTTGKTLDWVILPPAARFSTDDRKVLIIAPEPVDGKRIIGYEDGGTTTTEEKNIPEAAKKAAAN